MNSSNSNDTINLSHIEQQLNENKQKMEYLLNLIQQLTKEFEATKSEIQLLIRSQHVQQYEHDKYITLLCKFADELEVTDTEKEEDSDVEDLFVDSVRFDKKELEERIIVRASQLGRIDIFRQVFPNMSKQFKKSNKQLDALRLQVFCCRMAARGGHLDMLKCLREHDFEWNSDVCFHSASYKHYDLLKWSMEMGCPVNEKVCFALAEHGELELLKLAKSYFDKQLKTEDSTFFTSRAASYASRTGHLHVLKWLKEQNCPIDEDSYDSAAYGDHMNILEWLFEQNVPKGNWAMVSAAEKGNINVLNWLLEHGFPYNKSASFNACGRCQIKSLEWILSKGFPFSKSCLEDNRTDKSVVLFLNEHKNKIVFE